MTAGRSLDPRPADMAAHYGATIAAPDCVACLAGMPGTHGLYVTAPAPDGRCAHCGDRFRRSDDAADDPLGDLCDPCADDSVWGV